MTGRGVLLAAMLLNWTACEREDASAQRDIRSGSGALDTVAALADPMVSVFDSAPPIPRELPNPTERVREALPMRDARDTTVPRAAAPTPPVTPAMRANEEGLKLFARRKYAESVLRFAEALASAPNNAAYRNNYGWALFRAGKPRDAERELLEVQRMDPDREIAYANLGEVRLALGDVAGGTRAYQRFLELNNDSVRQRIAEEKLRTIRQP
jgi:tetratricopeptide (TPR) repeat protein